MLWIVPSLKLNRDGTYFSYLLLALLASGGEGSILGGAGAVIGVGSDIGGSIRMPCFFNGVFGHKTTPGKKKIV